MTPSFQQLCEQASQLNDIEKSTLVNQLLHELLPPNPGIEQVWAEEVDRRIQADKEGRLETLTYDQVMGKYLRPCG